MKKIYLSSGFFTAATREKVEEVAAELRRRGYEVFVPMEHFIEGADTMPPKQWAYEVFLADVKAMDECDSIVSLDFGANGDCGTAWELGYAYAKGIPVDIISYGIDISLMVYEGATRVHKAFDQNIKLV